MKIFIRAASCISPQSTFDQQLFLNNPVEYNSNMLGVIEPDYKNILDAKLLRRMSKIVRIGAATASACLKESGETNVDAIITGTAYGCMEDSENFLKSIILQNEEALSPTAFIQSTHNTVGAQIALMLKCHEYNNTFVHRGFSFEHALIDAMLLLNETHAQKILAGSADEITQLTFQVLQRFGFYKQSAISNLELYSSDSKGSIAGQGTAFFLLTNIAAEDNYAIIDGTETIYKPDDVNEIKKRINNFLATHAISTDEIDLVITGKNGDAKSDHLYDQLNENFFKNVSVINYKHLCGEYPTSTSFATWLAANILKEQKLPACFNTTSSQKKFKRILIYNNYQSSYHSLILLSACN